MRAVSDAPPPFSINMDVNVLGPAVKYPVPVGTPSISPFFCWDHVQTWDVPKVEDFPCGSGGSSSATVYNIGKERTVDTFLLFFQAQKTFFGLLFER